MKLSTPDEMDDVTEVPEEEEVTEPVASMEWSSDPVPVTTGVESNQRMIYDLGHDLDDLRELVEEQREAIDELTEAVELLAGQQGQLMAVMDYGGPYDVDDLEDAPPSVELDEEKILD